MKYLLLSIILLLNIININCIYSNKLITKINKYCTKQAINNTNIQLKKNCIIYILSNDIIINNCGNETIVINIFYKKRKECLINYYKNYNITNIIFMLFIILIIVLCCF